MPDFEGKSFQDVAREQLELPEGDGRIAQDAIDEEYKPLLKKLRKTLREEVDTVHVSRRLVDSAACVVTAEQDITPQIRRMLEATGQALPESKPVLEVNMQHPLLKRLSSETDERRFEALSQVILDHALLAQGSVPSNPASYVRRVTELILGDENR